MSKETDKKRLSKQEFADLLDDLNSLAAMPTQIPHSPHTNKQVEEQWIDDCSVDASAAKSLPIPSINPTPSPTKSKETDPNKESIEVKERWIDDESSDELLPILSVTPTLKPTKPKKQKAFDYKPQTKIPPSNKRRVQFERASSTRNISDHSKAYKSRKPIRSASFRLDANKSQKQRYRRNLMYSNRPRSKKYIYDPRKPGTPFGSTPRACNAPIRKDWPAVGLDNPKMSIKPRATVNGKIGKDKRFKHEKPRAAPTGLYDLKWEYVKKRNSACSFGSSNRFNKYKKERNRNHNDRKVAVLAEHYYYPSYKAKTYVPSYIYVCVFG